MYITQFTFTSIIIAFAVLFAGFIYLAIRSMKPKKRHHEDDINAATATIIDHAQNRARHIIDRAVEHSEETLYQTEFLKAELVKHGEESIQEVVSHIVELLNQDGIIYDKKYQELFEAIQKQYSVRMEEALKLLEQAAGEELETFRKTIREGTLGSQNKLDAKIEQEFAVARSEIEAYKVVQMKKIDDSVVRTLESLIKDVMGRAISLSGHEQLIFDALNSAREEGVFKSKA